MWTAFGALSGDRPVVLGGVGAIPFTAMDRYAERFGIDDRDEFERFLKLIRAMDREWRIMQSKPKTDA